MTATGDNINKATAGQIRALVERIERLEEEIRSINGDKKDVYTEARANGFDAKVLKRVVALRRQDQNERKEQDEILSMYLSALGMEV